MPRLAASTPEPSRVSSFKHLSHCGVVLAVGPEGPLVFLSGGVGSFIADRLELGKDDLPLLVYSSIAGAFGGFFGSPVIGAVGALMTCILKT